MGLAALLGNVTAVDAGSETPAVLLNVGRRIAIMYETALARTRSRQSRRLWLKAAGGVLCGTLACSLPGCSLGVMFGKMLGGDPMVPAEFRAMTREDLAKGKHTLSLLTKIVKRDKLFVNNTCQSAAIFLAQVVKILVNGKALELQSIALKFKARNGCKTGLGRIFHTK